jgi:hypothetical protein
MVIAVFIPLMFSNRPSPVRSPGTRRPAGIPPVYRLFFIEIIAFYLKIRYDNHMANVKISAAPSIRRLPSYLHVIRQQRMKGGEFISGALIARELNLEPIQVRKDLAITGITGTPKKGYQVFWYHGLRIIAAFDKSPRKIGAAVHGALVLKEDLSSGYALLRVSMQTNRLTRKKCEYDGRAS